MLLPLLVPDGRPELQWEDPEVSIYSPRVTHSGSSAWILVYIAHRTGYEPIDFECEKPKVFFLFYLVFFTTGSHAFQAGFVLAI